MDIKIFIKSLVYEIYPEVDLIRKEMKVKIYLNTIKIN